MKNKVYRKRAHWGIVAIIIVLILISLFIFQFVLAKEMQVKTNCEDKELAVFHTMLAEVPTSDVEARKLIESKIKMYENLASVCATITPATVNPGETLKFSPATDYPFETGIFEGQPGAYFHAYDAKIENHWKGIVNGERVIVFAGAWVKDTSQGFIAVMGKSPNTGQTSMQYFSAPMKSGALRIVDYKGLRLVIEQANNKEKLFFDMPSLSFINSLDEVVIPKTPAQILNTVQPTSVPYPFP